MLFITADNTIYRNSPPPSVKGWWATDDAIRQIEARELSGDMFFTLEVGEIEVPELMADEVDGEIIEREVMQSFERVVGIFDDSAARAAFEAEQAKTKTEDASI